MRVELVWRDEMGSGASVWAPVASASAAAEAAKALSSAQ